MKKAGIRKSIQFFKDNYIMIASLEAKGEEGCADRLLNLLEKNEAKKPEIYTDTRQGAERDYEVDILECPSCGTYICDKGDEEKFLTNYCCFCGQKLEVQNRIYD